MTSFKQPLPVRYEITGADPDKHWATADAPGFEYTVLASMVPRVGEVIESREGRKARVLWVMHRLAPLSESKMDEESMRRDGVHADILVGVAIIEDDSAE